MPFTLVDYLFIHMVERISLWRLSNTVPSSLGGRERQINIEIYGRHLYLFVIWQKIRK